METKKNQKKENNSNRVSFRLDDNTHKKLQEYCRQNNKKVSSVCRDIISNHFFKEKFETIESLAKSLERIMPSLEQHALEYESMKSVLKETVQTIYDVAADIKEMKKGHYLTYKTIDNQRKVFDTLSDNFVEQKLSFENLFSFISSSK